MSVTRNPGAVPLTTSLALVDGVATVLSQDSGLREIALAMVIRGVVRGATSAGLGTAANALYAQTLYAVTHAAGVIALVQDIHEGNAGEEEGASHGYEAELNEEPGTGHVAGFQLHLTATYQEVTPAAGTKRAAILAAIEAALVSPAPLVDVCMREQVLAALFAVVVATDATAERNGDRPAQAVARTNFLDGDMTVDHYHVDATDYVLSYAIELFAPGKDAAALDVRAQALSAALRAAERLGGLLINWEEPTLEPEALRERYTGPALGARLEGTATFRTEADEPTRMAA